MAETVAVAIANFAAEAFGADAIATYVAVYEAIPIIQLVASVAIMNDQQRRQQKKSTAAYNENLRDRYVMIRSATEPRQVVLGRQRVSGPVCYIGSYGTYREHLVFVVALAAHECDAIEDVYFDDERVTLDGSGNVLSVSRRDLFTLTGTTDAFTLTSAPDAATIVATVAYGTTVVTLGTSLAGLVVTVTGGTSGATGTVTISYQPAQSPYVVSQSQNEADTITTDGAGSGSVTLAHTPDAGSVKVIYVTGAGIDTNYLDITSFAGVAGAVVTVTGSPVLSQSVMVTYSYTDIAYRCRVRKYLGASGQTADSAMVSALPGIWTSSHTMTSICHLVVEADFDADAFPSGLMNVSAVVRGAKLYDPRTATTVWSQNPALMMRYVALSSLLGRQTSAEVNNTNIAAEATVCDVSSAYSVGGRTYTRARYTAGLTAKSGARAKDVLDDLAMAMGGKWAVVDGQLKVKAGGYTTPLQTLDERWLHNQQPIRYQARSNRADVFNVVTGKFADELRDYAMLDYPRVESSTYITEDGLPLEVDISMNAVTFSAQAQQVAACKMREARIAERFTVVCNMRAYPVELFDTLTVNLSRWGMAAEVYEVVDLGWSIDGGIMLTLQRTASTVWDLGSSFDLPLVPPNTLLPQVMNVPAVASLAAASGTTYLQRQTDGTILSRMRVTFTAPTDALVINGGGTEVRYGLANTAENTWRSIDVPDAVALLYITDALDGALYLVKARHFNDTVRGKWSAPVLHQMVGKSAAPANPTSVAATAVPGGVLTTWALNTEADYSDTEIRSGASWAAGTLVWRGTADRYLLPWPAAGSLTLWVAHRDTSKNYSATPVSVGLTVGAASLIDTPQIGVDAATEVIKMSVDTDTYNYPASFGVQDRTFTAISYANTSGAALEIEMSCSSVRGVAAPAGLVSTTTVKSWVAITNTTDSLLVSSTQDHMPSQVAALAASGAETYLESTIFNVSIPAGKTYEFQSYTRVAPNVGSTGNIQLVTSALTLRGAVIKR